MQWETDGERYTLLHTVEFYAAKETNGFFLGGGGGGCPGDIRKQTGIQTVCTGEE